MTKAMSVILTALNLCDLGATAKLGWYKNRPSRQRGSIIHLSPPLPQPCQSPSKTRLLQKCGGKNLYYGQCKNTAFTFPYYQQANLSSFASFLHFTFQLFSTIILCYIRWLSNHKMVCSMFID